VQRWRKMVLLDVPAKDAFTFPADRQSGTPNMQG
jgi:hypothetical protein